MDMYKFIAVVTALMLIAAPALAAEPKPAEKKPAVKAAAEAPYSFEHYAVQGALMSCLEPVIKAQDIAAHAVKLKLPELPADKAQHFNKTPKSRAFMLPMPKKGNVVMSPTGSLCQVFLREVDAKEFWNQIGRAFNAKSPFKPVDKPVGKLEEGVKVKNYLADMKGPVAVFVAASDKSVKDTPQASITIGRVTDAPKTK
jgi:hypothetical protein